MTISQRTDFFPREFQALKDQVEKIARSLNHGGSPVILRPIVGTEAQLGELYIDSGSGKLSFKDLSGTIRLINTTP